MSKPLKLKALGAEDLRVISAILQDAITCMGDLRYLSAEHRFIGVFSRFCWEDSADIDKGQDAEKPPQSRCRTGIHFGGILKVETQNLPRTTKSHVLELLAIDITEKENGAAIIDLVFAGDGTIRLHAECIDAHLKDLGESWPARHHPHHAID